MKDLRTIMTVEEQRVYDEAMSMPRVLKEIAKWMMRSTTKAKEPSKRPIEEVLMSRFLEAEGDAFFKNKALFDRKKFVQLFLDYASKEEPDLDIKPNAVGVYFRKLRPHVRTLRRYKDFTSYTFYQYPYDDLMRMHEEHAPKMKRRPTDREVVNINEAYKEMKRRKAEEDTQPSTADPSSIFGDLL